MSNFSKAVLIVDDNRSIRTALRIFLQGRSEIHVCGEAADGVEAIQKANELKPALVLMDLSMPNMNGVEAASVIRKVIPDVRIVLFTLYSDLVGKSVAKAVGVDLVVSKTEGASGLLNALRSRLMESPAPS